MIIDIKAERKKLGLTRKQLAEKSGLSINALFAWENGQRERPRFRDYVKLCEALGIEPGDSSELIRCKYCGNYGEEGCRLPDYNDGGMLNTKPDGFCSDAVPKRKEEK